MAGHDDRKRVPTERLSDLARHIRDPEACRDRAIRERLASGNGPRHLVDAQMECRDLLRVERDRVEIARLAAEQRRDAVDRMLHVERRRQLARAWKSTAETRAGSVLAPLRQVDARDP